MKCYIKVRLLLRVINKRYLSFTPGGTISRRGFSTKKATIMNDRLTRQDIEDMEREIEHRRLVVRPELLEHVKEARAQGDLSENFEYYAAKKAKK